MWIELHQTLPTHRKTLEAADRLDMKPVHLTGHLVTFWLWALDNAPEGNVKASPRTLAYAAQWDGDAQLFVDALVAAGFMDREGDGFTIHDWREYAGRLLDKRKKDAERKKQERDAARASSLNSEHVNGASNGHPADDLRMSERTVPNLTVPNQDQDEVQPTAGADAPHPEPKPLLFEVVGGKTRPVPKPRTPTPIRLVFEAYCVALDIEPGAIPKQKAERLYGQAKQLVESGYSADQVERCTRALRTHRHWHDKLTSLDPVLSEIALWVKNGESEVFVNGQAKAGVHQTGGRTSGRGGRLPADEVARIRAARTGT